MSRHAQYAVARAVELLTAEFLHAGGESLHWAFGQSCALLFSLLAVEFAAGQGQLASFPSEAGVDWAALIRCCRQLEGVFAGVGFQSLRIDERLAGADPGQQSLMRLRAVTSDLTCGEATPHATMSAVHQQLAGYRPELGSDGVRLAPAPGARRQHGQFYTPQRVADCVVASAFGALAAETPARPRVLDPSMGTGVFLLAALRRIVAVAPSADAAEIAETCLFGVDRDPMARELALLTFWLETGARPRILAGNLILGDFLRGAHVEHGFDLILGNPPWGVAVPAAEQAPSQEKTCGHAVRTVDSFKLFLEHASTATNGVVGMVVPQAVLTQTTHAGVRERLLQGLAPYWVAELGDRVFAGAAAPACALVFGPRPGPDRVTVCRQHHRQGRVVDESRHQVPRSSWSASGFPVAPNRLRELLDRLRSTPLCLGDLADRYTIRDAGLNYNRAAVARRSCYRAARPDDSRDLPCYRGRDFTRFGEVRQGGWLRHDARQRLEPGEQLSYSQSLMALPEKIVIRQTADHLVATLDGTNMVMGRSVLAITAAAGDCLPALLACLNSHLLTVLYRVLAGEEGRIMPQVKVARLRALPVPMACAVVGHAESPWQQLDGLARSLLQAHGDEPMLDRATDQLVYQLYGLDSAEIDLIEA